MKICEVVQLQELKTLDTTYYGGWISPKRKVFYVDPYSHADFMGNYLRNQISDEEVAQLAQLGINDPRKDWVDEYTAGTKLGWVRFVLEEMPRTFSLDGHAEGIKKTYTAWVPTAMQATALMIYDRTKRQDFAFYLPDDKAKLIQKYGPSAAPAPGTV